MVFFMARTNPQGVAVGLSYVRKLSRFLHLQEVKKIMGGFDFHRELAQVVQPMMQFAYPIVPHGGLENSDFDSIHLGEMGRFHKVAEARDDIFVRNPHFEPLGTGTETSSLSLKIFPIGLNQLFVIDRRSGGHQFFP
jgi:hypothetical protein